MKKLKKDWNTFGKEWANKSEKSIKESLESSKVPYTNRSNAGVWELTDSSKKEKERQGYGGKPHLIRSGNLVKGIKVDFKNFESKVSNKGMFSPWYASKKSRDAGGENGYSVILHEGLPPMSKARPHLDIPKKFEPGGTAYNKLRDKVFGKNFSKILREFRNIIGA